jgi:hypothetical protein
MRNSSFCFPVHRLNADLTADDSLLIYSKKFFFHSHGFEKELIDICTVDRLRSAFDTCRLIANVVIWNLFDMPSTILAEWTLAAKPKLSEGITDNNEQKYDMISIVIWMFA